MAESKEPDHVSADRWFGRLEGAGILSIPEGPMPTRANEAADDGLQTAIKASYAREAKLRRKLDRMVMITGIAAIGSTVCAALVVVLLLLHLVGVVR